MHSGIAVAVDENAAAGYILVELTWDAASGTSTTGSQSTGSTGDAFAGEVALITVETTRGWTTVTWTTTTNIPADSGGGTWDLTATSGTGGSLRRGSVGYVVLTGQDAQTWADTVTYGTARTSSAVIAAFVLPAPVTINDRPTSSRAQVRPPSGTCANHAHGVAAAPELADRTAAAPEFADRTALTPDLAHGDVGAPRVRIVNSWTKETLPPNYGLVGAFLAFLRNVYRRLYLLPILWCLCW